VLVQALVEHWRNDVLHEVSAGWAEALPVQDDVHGLVHSCNGCTKDTFGVSLRRRGSPAAEQNEWKLRIPSYSSEMSGPTQSGLGPTHSVPATACKLDAVTDMASKVTASCALRLDFAGIVMLRRIERGGVWAMITRMDTAG